MYIILEFKWNIYNYAFMYVGERSKPLSKFIRRYKKLNSKMLVLYYEVMFSNKIFKNLIKKS